MNYRDNYKYGQSTLQGGGSTNLQEIRTEILQDINDAAKPDLFVQNVVANNNFDLIPPSAWSNTRNTWIATLLIYKDFIVDRGNLDIDGKVSLTVPKFITDAMVLPGDRKVSIRVNNKPYYARNGRYDFSGNLFIKATEHGTGYYIFTVTVSLYTLTDIYLYSYNLWSKTATPLPAIDTTIDIKQDGFFFDYNQIVERVSAATKIPKRLVQVVVETKLAHTAPTSIQLASTVLQFKRLAD
jgi:hypothetical protein